MARHDVSTKLPTFYGRAGTESNTHLLGLLCCLKQADSSLFFYGLNIPIDWARGALPSQNVQATSLFITLSRLDYFDIALLKSRPLVTRCMSEQCAFQSRSSFFFFPFFFSLLILFGLESY